MTEHKVQSEFEKFDAGVRRVRRLFSFPSLLNSTSNDFELDVLPLLFPPVISADKTTNIDGFSVFPPLSVGGGLCKNAYQGASTRNHNRTRTHVSTLRATQRRTSQEILQQALEEYLDRAGA